MREARQFRNLDLDGADRFIPTRRSLLSRLKNCGDQDAWMTFFETYWKLIFATAVRAGLSDAEAQDVVQETLIGVWRKIPGFMYDPAKGSFKAWLLQQTSWRIKGQLRKRMPVEHLHDDAGSDTATTALERVPDPGMSALATSWDHEWEENLLEAALRRVKAKVDARQYQIFDATFRLGWPVSQAAGTLRISVASVYLARHRVSTLLKKELDHLKTKPI